MQKVMTKSRAWIITLVFLLVLAPVATLAEAGTHKEEINYVSLGDSLAAGQLSDSTLGIGYAGNIVKDLEAKGYDVNFSNKGVSGATSADVIAQLDPQELTEADIVTISAGANDLLRALDMSKIALFDASYLNPEAVAEMKNAVKTDIDSDIEAAIDMAEEPINEAAGKIATLHTAVENLEEAVKPYVAFLPEDMNKALTSIKSNLDHAKLKIPAIKEARDSFQVDEENSREILRTISNELESVSEDMSKINDAITMINSTIEDSPIPIPAEIVAGIDAVNTLSLAIKENIDMVKNMVDDALIKFNEYDERIAGIDSLVANAQEVQQMLANIPSEIEAVMKAVSQNTAQIIATVKQANPNVEVYVLGYYNAMPYLSPELQQYTVPLLVGLNDVNKAVADATGVISVPTFEAFSGKHEAYLPNPADIHPNETGYRVIADAFMGKIDAAFPGVSEPEPEPKPEEPGDPEEDPGESDEQLETVEIVLGNSSVEVFPGTLVTVKDTQTSIQLPEDLPAGTLLQVLSVEVVEQDGLVQTGEAFDFIFTYPEGYEDYQGEFVLTLGVTGEQKNASIYHYQAENQVWELIGGKLEGEKLTATVSHFSMYGVFAEEEAAEPPAKKEPSIEEKPTNDDDQNTAGGKVKEDNDKNKIDEKVKAEQESQKLPKTATNQYNRLIAGVLLILAGGSIGIIRRKSAIMK